jgi:hypothetical protein
VTIELPCSYCKAGLNRRRRLGSARPVGKVAEKIEKAAREGVDEPPTDPQDGVHSNDTEPVGPVESQAPPLLDPGLQTPSPEWDDILNTDFGSGFDLSQDLWRYS